MCIRFSVFIQLEEIPKVIEGEESLHIFLLVHDTAAQGLLVGLPLENLLLNRPSLQGRRGGVPLYLFKQTSFYSHYYNMRHIIIHEWVKYVEVIHTSLCD